MASRYTVDTNILRIRDVFALNPTNAEFIQPGEIPVVGRNGRLEWYSSLELLSTISIPTLSTNVLDLLTQIQPGISSISTSFSLDLDAGLASTVGGLATASYISESRLMWEITILSQVYKYVSATTLYDIIAHLGELNWIGDNGGVMSVIPGGSNFTAGYGYISTFSLYSTVAGLGTSGYLSSGTVRFSGANVGINCNSPVYTLDVNGTINARNGVLSNGTFLTSDSNIKENITFADLFQCYSSMKNIPLRRFSFIPEFAESKADKTQVGFIAQEVEQVFPKSIFEVYNSTMDSTIKLLNTDQIQMAHYGTTQLLMSTVEGQQKEIDSLKDIVARLVEKVGL